MRFFVSHQPNHHLPTDVINEISAFLFCICRDSLKQTCKTFYYDSHIIGYTDNGLARDLQLFLRNGEQMSYAWKNYRGHIVLQHKTIKMFKGLYEFYPLIAYDLWNCSFQSTYTLCAGTYLFYFYTNIFMKTITLKSNDGKVEVINQRNTVPAYCDNCMIQFTLHKMTNMEFICDEYDNYKNNELIYFTMCFPEYYHKKHLMRLCREFEPKPFFVIISSRTFV